MRLTQAHLKNICQHADLQLDFHPGITGIFGPNGVGKSNTVNMIQASLTGDFGVNPGKKDDNIRHDAPDDARSQIVTKWVHDGLPFTLTRSLRPTSQCLELPDRKITRAADIGEELTRLVGFDRYVLDEYVFVGQWQIFQFISADPATRQKSFMRLCNVARAEQLWTLLGQQIKQDNHLVADVIDNRKELRARIEERTAKQVDYHKRLAEAEEGVLSQGERTALKQVIEDCRRRKTVKNELGRLRTQLTRYKDSLQLKKKQIQDKQASVELLAAQAAKLAKEAEEISAAYEKQAVTRSTWQQRQRFLAVLEIPAPEAPREHAGYQGLAVENAAIQQARKDLAEIQQRLRLFEDEGVVECPTCGTDVGDLQEALDHWQEDIQTLQSVIRQRDEAARLAREYESKLQQYQKEEGHHNLRRTEAMAKLETLPEVDDPGEVAISETSVSEMRKAAKNAARFESDAVHEVRRLEQQHAGDSGAAKQLRDQFATLKAELQTLTASDADAEEAEERLAKHQQVAAARSSYQSILEELEQLTTQDKAEIKRITDLKKRSKSARKWLCDLEDWREVFHREALPRVVTQTAMENLVDQINQSLELFNGPFRVSAEDKLTFVAHKPRGYSEIASRLSGGEKVVLGIAFRFSVVRQVGMMILDEPTAGLDADNIDCLIDMLERLSEITKQRGQQVILITHDHRLERVLDHKIELQKVA